MSTHHTGAATPPGAGQDTITLRSLAQLLGHRELLDGETPDRWLAMLNTVESTDESPEIVAGALAFRAKVREHANSTSPENRAARDRAWAKIIDPDPRIKAIRAWAVQRGLQLSPESIKGLVNELAERYGETTRVIEVWGLDRVVGALSELAAASKTDLAPAAESIPEMKRLHALAASEGDPVTNPAARTLGWLKKMLPELFRCEGGKIVLYFREGDTPDMDARRAATANAIACDYHFRKIELWANMNGMEGCNAESVEKLIQAIAKELDMLPRVVERMRLDEAAGMVAILWSEGDAAEHKSKFIRALVCKAESRHQGGIPSLTLDPQRKTVALSGVTFEIKRKSIFEALRMIVEKDGDLVESQEIRDAVPGFRNPDMRLDIHFRNKLPEPLKKVIVGQNGPGGGYRLDLSAKK